MWSNVYDHLTKLFIIRRESLVFFSEMSHVLLQGHKLLRLGARYWLGAPNGWDTTGRSQVLGCSVGEPRTPDFYRVHQTILTPSTNPDRNPDNNLQNKMVERTYHEVLSAVVNELLHPILAVFTLHVCLYKQLYWAQLTSKRRSQ